ncbi:uncharacterized, partial [Tachysurus ichikawai]
MLLKLARREPSHRPSRPVRVLTELPRLIILFQPNVPNGKPRYKWLLPLRT